MKKRTRIQTSAAAVVLAAAMVFAIPAAAEPAQAASAGESEVLMTAGQSVSAAAKIKLNKKKINIKKGSSKKLKVQNANGKKVTWKSKNPKIASVNKNGKVKAKKCGTTTIIAKVGSNKLKCKVKVVSGSSSGSSSETTETNITYGSVTGNISYHYNQYLGYVADTNARIFLIPTDGSAKSADISKTTFASIGSYNGALISDNIYATKADGNGDYTISNIPTGVYFILIISRNSLGSSWFDADSKDDYYQEIADTYFSAYLSDSTALALAQSISFYRYSVGTIDIRENGTTTVSHAFPYTYI